MAGITDNGFEIKRLADIKEEFKAAFLAIFPDANMADETIDGQINSLFADAFSDIWELAQDIYNSNDRDAAEAYSLDKLANLVGVFRQQETATTTELHIYTSSTAYTIPAGYQFALTSDTDKVFETTAAGLSATYDHVQRVLFSDDPDSGTWTITVDGATTTALAYNAAPGTIVNAINALGFGIICSSVGGSISLQEIYINFNDSIKHVCTVASSLLKGAVAVTLETDAYVWGGIYDIVTASCLTLGSIQALAENITTIITVDANLTEVFNASDADTGSDLETDAELRLRLDRFIGAPSSNTESAIINSMFSVNNNEAKEGYIVDYATVLVDTTAKTIEPVFSYPLAPAPGSTSYTDKDIELATAIYNSRPAGVEVVGDEGPINVADPDGRNIPIKFTRPVGVPIYLEATVTTNSDFPNNGEVTIVNNILAWGDNIGVGNDVIVHGSDSLEAQISLVDGITDISIDIDTTNPPTGAGDGNITIDDGSVTQVEVSTWDSTNITITVV